MKYSFSFLILLIVAHFGFGQSPIEVTRISNLNFKLEKKEIRALVLVADSSDKMGMQINAKRPVNVSIIDPNGAVRVGKMVAGKSYSWLEFGGITGAWQITLENLLSFSKAELDLRIAITKPDFNYGSGNNKTDSVANQRSQTTITNGVFRVKKSNPLSFPVNAIKGDTLIVDIMPESGRRPNISITNDAGEWLHASRPAKEEKVISIPILNDGAYDIAIEGASFFGVFPSPFKQVFEIDITKKSPARYVNIANDTAIAGPSIAMDTMMEVYLDTVISLGAIRDILNPHEYNMKIKFSDPESILYWVLLFGSGTDYFTKLAELNQRVITDPISGNIVDPLAAFADNKLKSLPKTSNNLIRFVPSEDIAMALRGKNYGVVNFFGDESRLKLVNKSKSVGQKAHVRVVYFRSIPK